MANSDIVSLSSKLRDVLHKPTQPRPSSYSHSLPAISNNFTTTAILDYNRIVNYCLTILTSIEFNLNFPVYSASLLQLIIKNYFDANQTFNNKNNLHLLELCLRNHEFQNNEKFLYLEEIPKFNDSLDYGSSDPYLGSLIVIGLDMKHCPKFTLIPKPIHPQKRKYSDVSADERHVITLRVNKQQSSDVKEVMNLIEKPSVVEQANNELMNEIEELLSKKSAMQILINEKFAENEDVVFREYCEWGLKSECREKRHGQPCNKLHFKHIKTPNTVLQEGDCSYLNTCHNMDKCKYVHYELDEDGVVADIERRIPVLNVGTVWPAQWINCDVRRFDLSILGKFSVIMADPPWDIHMSLPYGTMTDDEMRNMAISELQDEGYLFLWVTGRATEIGRECLQIWGYERVDELVWVKINQVQRLIRTGRTGHWINHCKEHCLVGVKGRPKGFCKGIDGDVLVAEVRETSRKPDEIYGIIDRLAPGTRKIEIFGRKHNTRDGWITLGNQLDGVRIYEPDMLERYNERFPMTPAVLTPLPQGHKMVGYK
ncbi:N6-adenosine-methyltransferase subunit mettl3 [Nowakowskiella sp. JEL0407]|nr:N6-adenosine-methyltransferase subunit mettl3 [Nowakowskiella sp. JEL0407]